MKVVFIAPTTSHTRRRYHVTPRCAMLKGIPLAVPERGRYSAQEVGFKVCIHCAWHSLGRKVARCEEPHCQLVMGHGTEHYTRAGWGKTGSSVRW